MANYATANEAQTQFTALDEYADAVVTGYLTQAHGFILAKVGGLKGTLEGDTDQAALLKQIEMKLAYAYIVNRSHIGVGNERVVAEATEEREQALEQLDAAIVWAEGQSGSLYTEDITDAPTFDMGVPESWAVDEEGD